MRALSPQVRRMRRRRACRCSGMAIGIAGGVLELRLRDSRRIAKGDSGAFGVSWSCRSCDRIVSYCGPPLFAVGSESFTRMPPGEASSTDISPTERSWNPSSFCPTTRH